MTLDRKNTPILHRLLSTQRKYVTAKVRKVHRRIKKVVSKRVLTPVEKALRTERRRKARESLKTDLQACRELVTAEAVKLREKHGGHSVEFYRKAILQEGRLKQGRKVSPWNGWVYLEGIRLNDGAEDGKRLKAHEITKIAKESWDKMSPTNDLLPLLLALQKSSRSERRRLLEFVMRLFLLITTLDEHWSCWIMRALHARTSTEVLLVAVRKSNDHYNAPAVLVTSQRVLDFFDISVKENLPDFALKFEAFSLSGVQGVVGNYVQTTLQLKSQLASVILEKLRTVAGMPVPRMYYSGFDTAITAKYAVILECWPLEKFCSPSDIASRNELNVLLTAFQSGATRFRKLSSMEFELWTTRRLADTTQTSATQQNSDATGTTDATGNMDTNATENVNATTNAAHPQPSPFAPHMSASSNGNDENTPPPQSTTPLIPAKRKATGAPLQIITYNSGVTTADGTNLGVVKKPRKPRKDKGQPRGPRAKKA
ncbi:hypothetical protein BJ912DRAFT_1066409 [Pholiota molesta]|nr:hypothetical protein BJ912DRAFT_1066409 [Pholiota molesta]